MKKVIILLCLLMFSILPTWAEYKPIPKELSKQYKYEMESIINQEYPNVIKYIDELVVEAGTIYNKIVNNNEMGVINLYLISEQSLFDAELDLYVKLMRTTQEKYLGTEYTPFATDNTGPLDEFLYPYFRDNNVNASKLIKIGKYEYKKNKIIEKYIKQAEKLRPNSLYN